MTFWKRWLEASKNPDKFWADWHRERRQKRLEYWRKQAAEAERRFEYTLDMVIYYQEKIRAGDNRDQDPRT